MIRQYCSSVTVCAAWFVAQSWAQPTWVQRKPTNSPSARAYHAMAFDAARGTVLLFGGQIGATFMNDTWSWDGAVWTQLNPSTTPPPLLFPAMVYDVAHQKVVLVGGNAGQTWTWDGSNWTQQTPAHTPTPAMLASLTYDLKQAIDDNDVPGTDLQRTEVWPASFGTFSPKEDGAWVVLE